MYLIYNHLYNLSLALSRPIILLESYPSSYTQLEQNKLFITNGEIY